MTVLKIAIIGIVGVLLAVPLKEYKSGFAVYLSLATGLLIGAWAIGKLGTILSLAESIQNMVSINQGYLTALLKMLGITYVVDFGASLCKDAGHSGVAHQMEVFGKLSILAVSMPILTALIETIERLL